MASLGWCCVHASWHRHRTAKHSLWFVGLSHLGSWLVYDRPVLLSLLSAHTGICQMTCFIGNHFFFTVVCLPRSLSHMFDHEPLFWLLSVYGEVGPTDIVFYHKPLSFDYLFTGEFVPVTCFSMNHHLFTVVCLQGSLSHWHLLLWTIFFLLSSVHKAVCHRDMFRCEPPSFHWCLFPGEFMTQTCFQGRFGAETGGDQFGAHIIAHAPNRNSEAAVLRLSYIEVTHAGQAFRLGRYPVHLHLNGDMSSSYVRGLGIHNSFNRAVNVHGTHNALIEHVVSWIVFLSGNKMEITVNCKCCLKSALVAIAVCQTTLFEYNDLKSVMLTRNIHWDAQNEKPYRLLFSVKARKTLTCFMLFNETVQNNLLIFKQILSDKHWTNNGQWTKTKRSKT